MRTLPEPRGVSLRHGVPRLSSPRDVESGDVLNPVVVKIAAPTSAAKGALYLALNFVAAISCIFVNRRLMKPPVSFELPIAITFVGYSSSVVSAQILR